jgi:hypothetical protein
MCEGKSYLSLLWWQLGSRFRDECGLETGGPSSGETLAVGRRLCIPLAEARNGSLAKATRAHSISLAKQQVILRPPAPLSFHLTALPMKVPSAATGRNTLGITTILQEVNRSLLDRFTILPRSPFSLHSIIELLHDGSLYYHRRSRSRACR